jgi:putative colanic acid biosynthesis acetyltransferase WcaF
MHETPTATELLDVPPEALDDPRLDVDLSTYRKTAHPLELVLRALWECVQLPFYPVRPRALSPLRVALLRMFGAKIGRNVLICGGVRIHVPWNLEIGDHTAIGDKVEIYNLAPVRIGEHSTISQHAYLCASSHDYTRSDFPLYSLTITIGKQAWVASGAFIGPGVTMGEGAVVGARSVVLRDVPPWTIAAGNPCRVIRPRVLRRADDAV